MSLRHFFLSEVDLPDSVGEKIVTLWTVLRINNVSVDYEPILCFFIRGHNYSSLSLSLKLMPPLLLSSHQQLTDLYFITLVTFQSLCSHYT